MTMHDDRSDAPDGERSGGERSDRAPDETERLVRAVRGASGPALDAGAAERIAAGAWERAQSGRQTSASRSFLRATPLITRRWSRRWAVAAVAVVAFGIGAYTLRPTEPAFAIDGDPVQVLRGDRWVREARKVEQGATVFVADGVRTLRGPGAQIVPEPGSTFRIVGDADTTNRTGTTHFRIEILGGGAEVRGDAVHIAMADVDVERTPLSGEFCMFASVPPALDGLPAPQLSVSSSRLADARFEIRIGKARVSRRSTGEQIDLERAETVALLPVRTRGPRTFRLGRLRKYTTFAATQIASGHPVIQMHDAPTGTIAVLGGPGESVTGLQIDREQLPDALDDMHSAMLALVTEINAVNVDVHVRGEIIAAGSMSVPIEQIATNSRQTVTELVHTVHGREHRVIVNGDGVVVVEHIGGGSATYPSLDSARENDPEAVKPLDRFLKSE